MNNKGPLLRKYSIMLAMFILLAFQNVLADAENEIVIDGAVLKISETANSAAINIELNNSSHKVEAIIVENPKRLVFDIKVLSSKGGKNLNISSQLFKKVRIGLHRDKTRIVLDCNSEDISNLQNLSVGDKISFTVSGSSSPTEKIEKAIKPSPTPEISNKSNEKKLDKSEPIIDSEAGVVKEPPAKASPHPTPTASSE